MPYGYSKLNTSSSIKKFTRNERIKRGSQTFISIKCCKGNVTQIHFQEEKHLHSSPMFTWIMVDISSVHYYNALN